MRVLAVADYPKLLEDNAINTSEIDAVDLILSCGDLPLEYLELLHTTFKAPLYFVKGNHDIRKNEVYPDGCFNIHMQVVPFYEVNIAGLEGSKWYNGGVHQYTEQQMRRMVRQMRPALRKTNGIRGVDIVITHAPPRFVNDAEDPCHQGFFVYRALIRKYKPRCFFHGHIHDAFSDDAERITEIESTKVVNCCGSYQCEI